MSKAIRLNSGMNNNTIMERKESAMLEPFFKSARHWHFVELMEETCVCRAQVAHYLRKFVQQGLILRIKKKGKMPIYTQNFDNPAFRMKKRLYALSLLTNTGLLDHLNSLRDAKVVILFGSFSRADWHKDSDIDIFIYGKSDDFEQAKFEAALKREIQVHEASNKKEMKKMSRMLPYIIAGDFIKGSIDDLGVKIHAEA